VTAPIIGATKITHLDARKEQIEADIDDDRTVR